jgi:hypothetical protein
MRKHPQRRSGRKLVNIVDAGSSAQSQQVW